MLEVSLLGPVLLRRGGAPAHVSTVSSRAVLAYLAAGSGQAHHRGALARMLWPERTQAVASTNLRQAIARLRRAADDPSVVLTDGDSLRIGPDVGVDTTRFTQLLARSAAHAHPDPRRCPECLAWLAEATGLNRGEFCAGLFLRDAQPMDEWLTLTRERLHRQVLLAWDVLADGHAHAGDHDAAAAAARRQLELEPWRESAHRHLMAAYAAAGERDLAVEQYRRCARALDDELGIGPEPATTALHERLRSRTLTPRDLGGTPDPHPLHGRVAEVAQLRRRLADPDTRLVALLGLGGVGMTTLAAAAVRATPGFEVVVWRSLLNAPPLDALLCGLLPAVAGPGLAAVPTDTDGRLDLLFDLLRTHRCLLVLDNAESVLATGTTASWRPGYEPFGRLLARAAGEPHRGCVLLTSRERPPELGLVPADDHRVHVLALAGLDAESGRELFAANGLTGNGNTADLVTHYSGNPLALTLVARTVQELFAGDVDAFLHTGIPIFDGIRAVLDEQHARLTLLERRLLAVLAVARVALPARELRGRLLQPGPARLFVDALGALRRRSLLEETPDGFTLQHVIMEYVTDRVVDEAVAAVTAGVATDLEPFALLHPDATEHVRESQARLVLAPIAAGLNARLGRAGLAAAATALFDRLRGGPPTYAAGNLLNLLLEAGVDPSGADLSGLAVWHADLRGRTVRDLDLRGADLHGTAFTDTFGITRCVAVSPNGALLAIGTDDGEVRLWEQPGGAPAGVLTSLGARVSSIVFGPGDELVAGGSDGVVRIWDVHRHTLLRTLAGPRGGVSSVAVSPDGARVAAGGSRGGVLMWDLRTGTPGPELDAGPSPNWSVAFSPDGSTVAGGDAAGGVRLWSATTGALRSVVHEHTDIVHSVAFSPDGRVLATSSSDRGIRIRDADTGAPLAHLVGHTNLVWSLSFAPDGTALASAAGDGTIRLWDTAGWSLRRTLHTGVSTSAVRYSADGATLIGALFDQTLRTWDARTGETLLVRHGHTPAVISLAAGPGGALLAGGIDGHVRVWDVPARSLVADFPGHAAGVTAVAGAGTARPATGSADRTIRLWDLSSVGGSATVLHGHTDEIAHLALDPTGTLLASCAEDRTIRLWDARTGAARGVLAGHEHWVISVLFGAEADLWSVGHDGVVLRWDLADHTRIGRIDLGEDRTFAAALDRSGRTMAVARHSGSVSLVDTAAGTVRERLHGHRGQVISVGFAPDGETLASAGADGTVRTWDPATGAPRLVLAAHRGWAWAATFTLDGLLVSGGADGLIRLWDPDTGADRGTLVADGPYARTAIGGATGLSPARADALRALGAVDGQLIACTNERFIRHH